MCKLFTDTVLSWPPDTTKEYARENQASFSPSWSFVEQIFVLLHRHLFLGHMICLHYPKAALDSVDRAILLCSISSKDMPGISVRFSYRRTRTTGADLVLNAIFHLSSPEEVVFAEVVRFHISFSFMIEISADSSLSYWQNGSTDVHRRWLNRLRLSGSNCASR